MPYIYTTKADEIRRLISQLRDHVYHATPHGDIPLPDYSYLPVPKTVDQNELVRGVAATLAIVKHIDEQLSYMSGHMVLAQEMADFIRDVKGADPELFARINMGHNLKTLVEKAK